MNIKNTFAASWAALAILAAHLAGQGMNARILGNVRDEGGAALAGVLVTAINVSSNATTTAFSAETEGSFRMLVQAPGTYQVSFELPGYETYTAAGINLSVEQSITLRIRMKKAAGDSPAAVSIPATADRENAGKNPRFFDERGRFSLHFTLGMDRLAVGDSNSYLSAFSQRAAFDQGRFATLHWGTDLNVEIGYRLTPHLELAAGVGVVQGRLKNSRLALESANAASEEYAFDLDLKTVPLELVCRYWLVGRGQCLFSVQGAVQYHFATWKMDSRYSQYSFYGYFTGFHRINETASRQGLGLALGGRAEVKIDEHYSLIAEVSGRYAPLRKFSGRRLSFENPIQVIDGKLWSYEYYDRDSDQWRRGLGIGERPTGGETRNVASAKVDFSGLALRFGLLFHF